MGLFRLRKCRLGACATCRHCARRFNLWYYCALGYGFFGHLSDHDACDHFDYYLHHPANSPADAATLDDDNIEETEFEVDFIEEGSDDAEDFDDDGYMDDDAFGDEAYDDDYRDDFFDQERYDEDYYYYGNDGGEYD